MSLNFRVERLKGIEAKKYFKELAHLRISIFRDYPYLYDGDLDYEKDYLQTYFANSESMITVCHNQSKIIGMMTNILMRDEELVFKTPFAEAGYDPSEVAYLGEILIQKEFRGRGIGRVFMDYAEQYAKSFPQVRYLALTVVIRPGGHSLEPEGYKNLDSFWEKFGYTCEADLVTYYRWKDIDEKEDSIKLMQYWVKKIR